MAHAAQIESLDVLKVNAALTPNGVVPRDVGKSPERFGRTAVPAAQLRGRLGPTTWRVWVHAAEVRGGSTGAYFEKRSTCARELGLSEKQVKKSFERLTAAGLARVVSKKWVFVEGQRHHWHTTREVLGHFGTSSTGHVVMVPAATALWVRCGVVRKYAKHEPSSGGCNHPPPARSGGRNPVLKGPQRTTSVKATVVVSSDEETRSAPRAHSLPVAEATTSATATGTRLGGGGKGPPVLPTNLPPYPDSKQITAVVPKPPQLPATATLSELATLLLKAYRGAVESRTKARCFVWTKGFERGKDFRKLVEAGQKMRELELPPAAWAAWRIGQWMTMGNKGMPSVGWVFTLKAVEEHHGWFTHEMDETGVYGGRVIFSEPARELFRLYHAMQSAMLRERPTTDAAVRAVVERYLPGNTYAELHAAARKHAEEDFALMAKRVAEGGWVWG